MGRNGKVEYSELKKLKKNIEKLSSSRVDELMEVCAKELAARLLAKVIKRTPTRNYRQEVEVVAKRDGKKHKKGEKYTKKVNPTGKQGGTLKRGWTAGKEQNTRSYANSLQINRKGNNYIVVVENPVEYASYVEFGHRQEPGRYVKAIGKRLKKSWVPGKFMLTISEQEIQSITPRVLENKIKKFLEECLNDK